jgi:hypothetical protein
MYDVSAARVTTPPVLDGKLTDAYWKTAVPVTGFRRYGSHNLADFQSFGYVAYDDDNLYIAVRCLDPDPENVKSEPAEHDGDVFSGDSLEIMLKPADEDRYFQFVVNASGSIWDALRTHSGGGTDPRWQGGMETATAIGEEHWALEARVPFYSLEITPNVRAEWGFNICRNKHEPRGLSAIAIEGQYNEPWKFARLTGLDVDFRKFFVPVSRPELAVEVKDGAPSASATVSLTNSTGRDRRLKIEFQSDGKLLRTEELSLASDQQATVNLGPVSLRPDPADQRNVYALVETAPASQLVVSDAESKERLALSNLRYPSELKMLELDLIQSDASEVEAMGADARPMTIELISGIDEAGRQKGSLRLTVIREDASEEVATRSVAGPARVTRFALDRSSLPIGKLLLQATFRNAGGQAVAETERSFVNFPAREKVGKVLNNLVTELLNVKTGEIESKTRSEFTNPRNGWVFFSTGILG